MKPFSSPGRFSRLASAALGLLLLLVFSGCLEQVCVWSPDGRRAAILNTHTRALHLCDVDGQLSPPLVPDVYRVAWLGDSQRLVLARRHPETHWPALARALGETRAAALVARAEAAWQKLQAGTRWTGLGSTGGLFASSDPDWTLAGLFLRQRYGDAFLAKLDAGERHAVTTAAVDIHELVMARIDADRIVTGTQLFEGVDDLIDLRVAPGDRAVAFTAEFKEGSAKDGRLWVAAVDTSTPQLVAERVAAYPDWTADGRSLVYAQASGPSNGDDLRLGTLVRREVLDAQGRLRIAADPEYLAGWVFSDQSRVRCLRDGRILFNAAEFSLPIAAADYGEQHEQLFALDPAHQSTLVRLVPRKQEENLPKSLAFFEPSPDERQVLVGDLNGRVALLTLATGEVQTIQPPSKETIQGAPAWRAAGEFTYTRFSPPKDGARPPRAAEIVLRRGEHETVLSRDWPDEQVNALVSDHR